MSFLSSVLNSISKGEDAKSFPPSRPISTLDTTTNGVKRKADTELERPEPKVQRTGDGKEARVIKPLPARANGLEGLQRASDSAASARPGSINNGNGVTASVEKTATATVRPPQNKAAAVARQTTDPRKPLSSTDTKRPNLLPKARAPASNASSSTQAPSQPKKGSFKDLMERAKAAQTVAVGKILHKPAERITKKERMAMKKGQSIRGKETTTIPAGATAKAQPRNSARPTGKPAEKPSSKTAGPSKYQGTSKPKAPARTTYQGTAKPVTKPGYKGTSKPGAASSSRNDKPAKREERNEYLGTDEEDEGEYGYDSEGQYSENSEDFSDMDAGFDEIGDEEEEAERQAKLDDVREQRLLDKLAREKADKKRGRF